MNTANLHVHGETLSYAKTNLKHLLINDIQLYWSEIFNSPFQKLFKNDENSVVSYRQAW